MIQVLDTGRLDVYNDPRKDFEDWGVSNAGGTEMSMPIQRGCDVLYYDSRITIAGTFLSRLSGNAQLDIENGIIPISL